MRNETSKQKEVLRTTCFYFYFLAVTRLGWTRPPRPTLSHGDSLSPSSPAISRQRKKITLSVFPVVRGHGGAPSRCPRHEQSIPKRGRAPREKTSPTWRKHTKKRDRQPLLPISGNQHVPDHAAVKRRGIHSHE